MININLNHLKPFVREHEIDQIMPDIDRAFDNILNKQGPGNDFLGWVDLPVEYDRDEFDRVKAAAERVRANTDVLVVIGIGGSYLGARAVIEALSPSFKLDDETPEIIFAGHQLSADYLHDLIAYLDGKDVTLNVISKSGTTTEPAIAFRILKQYMEDRYGKEESVSRIYVTTDRQRGALKQLANEIGYETFVIADDIGGRYSVLTAVGLLPIAVAGIDIDRLMEGARKAREAYGNKDNLKDNPVARYVAARNLLLRRGYAVEILVNYMPQMMFFNEWWKQLYGESEGKDGKGLFPAAVNFTTDLHSLGQFIQDGSRIMFETVLDIKSSRNNVEIPEDQANLDGLNFLAGMTLDDVNNKAMIGTMIAHEDGGTPGLRLSVDKLDAYTLGGLIYFFELACGVSGHVLAVNPFDQPGVEAYKVNMFALLGKPGYEEQRQALEDRLPRE